MELPWEMPSAGPRILLGARQELPSQGTRPWAEVWGSEDEVRASPQLLLAGPSLHLLLEGSQAGGHQSPFQDQ